MDEDKLRFLATRKGTNPSTKGGQTSQMLVFPRLELETQEFKVSKLSSNRPMVLDF